MTTDMIKIVTDSFNGEEVNTVNARDLYFYGSQDTI